MELQSTSRGKAWKTLHEIALQERGIFSHFLNLKSKIEKETPLESWLNLPQSFFEPHSAFQIGWGPVLPKDSNALKVMEKTFGITVRSDNIQEWQAPILHATPGFPFLAGSDFFSIVPIKKLQTAPLFHVWKTPGDKLFIWNYISPSEKTSEHPSSILFFCIDLQIWLKHWNSIKKPWGFLKLGTPQKNEQEVQKFSLSFFSQELCLSSVINQDFQENYFFLGAFFCLLHLGIWCLFVMFTPSRAKTKESFLPLPLDPKEKSKSEAKPLDSPLPTRPPSLEETTLETEKNKPVFNKKNPLKIFILSEDVITQTLIRTALKHQGWELFFVESEAEIKKNISFNVLIIMELTWANEEKINIDPFYPEDPFCIRIFLCPSGKIRPVNTKKRIYIEKPLNTQNLVHLLHKLNTSIEPTLI